MEAVNEWCAGLDVQKQVVVACVLTPDVLGPAGQPKPVPRRFGTMTEDPVVLAGWLAERGEGSHQQCRIAWEILRCAQDDIGASG